MSDKQTQKPMTKKTAPACWLTVIGLPASGYQDLSSAAKTALEKANQLFASKRQAALIPTEIVGKEKRHLWPSPMLPRLQMLISEKPQNTVILASGDPMCWGIGIYLTKHLTIDEVCILPAPSILTLIAAKMHWPTGEIKSLSLCSQPLERLAALLQPGRKLVTLSQDGKDPAKVAALLKEQGYGLSNITILENLGASDEKISKTTPARLTARKTISPLNSLAIECVKAPKTTTLSQSPGLPDDAFEHDGQITRQNIRAITLAHLRPIKGELLWDIGLGSGAIAIEWLRAGDQCRAIGIEKNKERLTRAIANAARLGVPELETRHGMAGDIIKELESPDAIFIGGGITEKDLMQTAITALKPGGRLVANTVTLEGESLLIAAKANYGGTLYRFSMEVADKVGSFQGWRPQMTITQWVFHKKLKPRT